MCDCDPPEFYDASTRKARKRHICCECLTGINRGDSYRYATGKWGGDFQAFHTCLPCWEMRATLEADAHCCIPFEHIADEILDRRADTPGQAAWLERYRANWGQLQREREATQ